MDSPAGTVSRFVWETRYRSTDAQPAETSIEDTWRRVAAATAAVERNQSLWSGRLRRRPALAQHTTGRPRCGIGDDNQQ
jgi:hypothetical protein